jgi:hypothetical protein
MSEFARPDQAVMHHVRVQPSRSMKAITSDVEVLLDGLEERSRRSGALLASELVAQVVGRAPGLYTEPVALTVQLRQDAVRLEATGPVAPSTRAVASGDAVPADQLADWGPYIMDRLADRWGVGGAAPGDIWAEIKVPA